MASVRNEDHRGNALEGKLKQPKRLKTVKQVSVSSQSSWPCSTEKLMRLKSQGWKGGKLEARTA